MGKINGEIKVATGLLYRMILNGTSNAEKERIKDYISKLFAARDAYNTDNIPALKEKYKKLYNDELDIPEKIRMNAKVETSCILSEILGGPLK